MLGGLHIPPLTTTIVVNSYAARYYSLYRTMVVYQMLHGKVTVIMHRTGIFTYSDFFVQ